MDIHISLEKVEPLTGAATTETGEERPFEGWMGLLGAISELVDRTQEAARESAGEAQTAGRPNDRETGIQGRRP